VKIAVASGKGGTGKTTVCVNLARVATQPVTLLDCDVEEPNAHLFIACPSDEVEPASIWVPRIDEQRCDACGECSAFCAFNAIAMTASRPKVFEELCHACGGCAKVCPKGAIDEVPRPIGTVTVGRSDQLTLITGRLDIGMTMAPPLIRAVRSRADDDEQLVLIDAPPGTTCPVVTAVSGCDFVVLVTEPTPFGVHDLGLAVEALEACGIPMGVVINRSRRVEPSAATFCKRKGIPVLLELPDDRRIAEAYSRGEVLVEALPEYRAAFELLLLTIRERAANTHVSRALGDGR
jgi:MinD superfamily P-loop ATPase